MIRVSECEKLLQNPINHETDQSNITGGLDCETEVRMLSWDLRDFPKR